jgi:hypothetical protein
VFNSQQSPLISRLTSPLETMPSYYRRSRRAEFQAQPGRHQHVQNTAHVSHRRTPNDYPFSVGDPTGTAAANGCNWRRRLFSP